MLLVVPMMRPWLQHPWDVSAQTKAFLIIVVTLFFLLTASRAAARSASQVLPWSC